MLGLGIPIYALFAIFVANGSEIGNLAAENAKNTRGG